MLLAVWTTLVLVVPKVSVIVSGQIVKVPSAQELQGHKDAVLLEIQGEAQKKVMAYQQEMGKTMSQLQGAGTERENRAKEERDRFLEKVKALQADLLARQAQENARLDNEYQRFQQRHTQLALLLSRVSPASAMTYAVTTLAGTGIDRHERFRSAVRVYKEQFVTYVNAHIFENLGEVPEGKLDLSGMPVFEYREESLEASLQKIAPDVLVLDMRLPDTDGIDLLRRIRMLHPDLPVVITTAYLSIEPQLPVLDLAYSGYIVKPFDLDDLGSEIDAAR